MIKDPQVTLFDLVVCLSDAMDLISPALVNHHKRVAYIASSLGQELGLSEDKQKDLFLAGALHDIGALSLAERIEAMQFEVQNEEHAELGSELLNSFEPFAFLAPLVHFHHTYWDNGKGAESKGKEVPLGSHILHLADRVATLINSGRDVLDQKNAICETIKTHAGKMFKPEIVNAFLSLSAKEHFWLDAISPTIFRVLRQRQRLKTIELDLTQLNQLAMFFSKIIDFRSPFTATHSVGVAASAEALAQFAGFSKRECQFIRIAGLFHDLGKLAVPKEILEKPGKLTKEEFNTIRCHTYYTYRLLDTLNDFDTINTWGAFHHERLDGNGYPFHHDRDNLSLGSRIMCIADVFTAIAEDRPYRKGMSSQEIIEVLTKMADNLSLDRELLSLFGQNFDHINQNREAAQLNSKEDYKKLFDKEGF